MLMLERSSFLRSVNCLRVYLEEVSDVICIAQAELPSLLALNQIAEALLRVKHGPWLLCQLVANAPDSFEQG